MQRLLGEPLSLKGRATSDPQQCLVGTMEGHTLLQAGLLQPACAAPGGPGKVGAGRGDGLPGKSPHLQSLRPSVTSEVKPVPQHPPRGQRFSRRAYLGEGGIEQLAGFVACGGERQPRVLPGLQQQGAPSVGPWSPTPALAHHSHFQCLAGMQGCDSIMAMEDGCLGECWAGPGKQKALSPRQRCAGPGRTRPDPERTLCVGSGRTGP